jgi:very-short-patch-repair endonuclease
LLEVLARRPAGAPPTESDAETLFLQLSRLAGVGEPVRQYQIVIKGQKIRIDFVWMKWRIAVEIDGAATHATVEAFGRDLRRQNRIVFGWLLLRFTWEDVSKYPEQVLEVFRDACALQLVEPLVEARHRA